MQCTKVTNKWFGSKTVGAWSGADGEEYIALFLATEKDDTIGPWMSYMFELLSQYVLLHQRRFFGAVVIPSKSITSKSSFKSGFRGFVFSAMMKV